MKMTHIPILRLLTVFCILFPLLSNCHAVDPRNLRDFTLGLNSHRISGRDQPLLENLRLESPRIDFLWSEAGRTDGSVDTAKPVFQSILNSPKIINNSVIILCYGHPAYGQGNNRNNITTDKGRDGYVKYALAIVSTLVPKTRIYEVWNEWGARVEDYVLLLKNTYQAIKKSYPNSIILGGAVRGVGDIDDYLPKALNMGILDDLDGLVIHPYFYGLPNKANRIPEKGVKIQLNKIKEWLNKYPKGARVPLYLTELGWPTYNAEDGVSPDVQAKFMARSVLLLATNSKIKGVWIYELRDGGTDPLDKECHFGLLKNDGTPKPAFWVMKDLKMVLDESKSIETMPMRGSKEVMMMRLQGKEGGVRWLCWTIQPNTQCKFRISGLGKEEHVSVCTLGKFDFPGGWRDEKEGAEIEVGDMPVCIESPSINLILRLPESANSESR